MFWQLLGNRAPQQTQYDQLLRNAKICNKPGYDNIKKRFDEDLSIVLGIEGEFF